jgi:sec-independent protein translocase protein TatA
MGEFSLTHILLIAVIALIFFGPSRLPALGQSLGKAIRGFKQGINEIDAEVKPVNDEPPAPAQQIKASQQDQQAQSQTQSQKDKINS